MYTLKRIYIYIYIYMPSFWRWYTYWYLISLALRQMAGIPQQTTFSSLYCLMKIKCFEKWSKFQHGIGYWLGAVHESLMCHVSNILFRFPSIEYYYTLQWHHLLSRSLKSPATRLFYNSLFRLITRKWQSSALLFFWGEYVDSPLKQTGLQKACGDLNIFYRECFVLWRGSFVEFLRSFQHARDVQCALLNEQGYTDVG